MSIVTHSASPHLHCAVCKHQVKPLLSLQQGCFSRHEICVVGSCVWLCHGVYQISVYQSPCVCALGFLCFRELTKACIHSCEPPVRAISMDNIKVYVSSKAAPKKRNARWKVEKKSGISWFLKTDLTSYIGLCFFPFLFPHPDV